MPKKHQDNTRLCHKSTLTLFSFFLSSSLMSYIAESKNVQEMRIKIITELLGLIHERWQSLELFCWEGEDESGADCGSQHSQAHSIGLSFYFIA